MIELSPQELELDDDKIRAFEALMKRKRQEKYKDQVEAARAIGVSQDYISRIESRFTPNMRLGEFSMIIKDYGVVPNQAFALLGLYDSPIPDDAHREYIHNEILPLFDDCSWEKLQEIRRVIQAMVHPHTEKK